MSGPAGLRCGVLRDSPGVKDPWQQSSATPEDTAKTWLLPILMILAPRANQRPPPPFPQDPEPAPDHRPRPRPLLPRLPSTCPLFDPFWNPQVASPRQPYCIAPFLVCLPQIIKLHPAAARERSTPYLSSSSVSRPRPPRLGPAKPDDVVLQMWDDAVISGGWAGPGPARCLGRISRHSGHGTSSPACN